MKPSRLLIVLVIGLLIVTSGVAMTIGKSKVLCSPFSGTAILQDGTPVPGVRMVRTWVWSWNKKSGEDTTTADEAGRFSFPAVTGNSFTAGLLPHEPNVKQTIIAHTDKGELKIWSATKKTYEMNSELHGRPIRVKCYLDREPSEDGLYWGTCVEDTGAAP